MLTSYEFLAKKARISAIAAIIAPAFRWDTLTPSDIAAGLFLLDWKLAAFGHKPAISDQWTRSHLGLPIAPEGDEGLALAAVLEDMGSQGAEAFAPGSGELTQDVIDLAELLAAEIATFRTRQDLQLRFYAATPVYSSPERAPMTLSYYAASLSGAPLHKPEAWRRRKIRTDRLQLTARKLIGPKHPPARY